MGWAIAPYSVEGMGGREVGGRVATARLHMMVSRCVDTPREGRTVHKLST